MIQASYGKTELLKQYKTAFLCSRKIPASAVLKCYDWAIQQRDAGHCVVSGFHSKLEKDVLHFLMKGTQPIIVMLARGIKQNIEPEFKKETDKGRLLLVSPFETSVKRVTEETAYIRNKAMIEMADEIVVGYKDPNGGLARLLHDCVKPIKYLAICLCIALSLTNFYY